MNLILTPSITPRLQYTAEIIFRHFSNTPYKLTTSNEEFQAYQGGKINYTQDYIPGIPWIKPSGLLFSNKIETVITDTEVHQGLPVLFPSGDPRTLLPFDVFAAVFYIISRYEEYLPFKSDVYGRFPATESILYKTGCLNIPVVDHWVNSLTACIKNREFTFISTIDIDNAYAYKGKGCLRAGGGLLSSLFKGNFDEFKERCSVLTGSARDPYDTYDYILNLHKNHNINPLYFILFAEYGPMDKNLSVGNPKFQQLIRSLDTGNSVGIHPSFASSLDVDKTKKEIQRLAAVTGKPILRSRQHYLRLHLPDTYRILLKNGIQEDYSMGYADLPGFRAGTCTPFPFYDLQAEVMTRLTLFPFAVMEGTLKDYLHYSPHQALSIINDLMDEVKKVKGTFISLWHNESLSDQRRWKGWREVFKKMLEKADLK
jgi:hypothetical protein